MKYFVTDDSEIYKIDKGDNWYVFRHGRWDSQCSQKPGDWIISEHKNLASARKACLKHWIEEFEKFKVWAMPMGFNAENDYYQNGDEDAPFWSESFLYPLLGKEDARSVLARLRRLNDISKAY